MQAARLLFDQPDSTEPSIFGKPADLAEFLFKHGLYSGQVLSIQAFLTQIIQRGERSCPERLAAAICEAVRLKLAGRPEAEREQKAEFVRRAIEVDDVVRRTALPMSAEALYFELLNLSASAADHYIITSRPAEQVVSDRADNLRGILLQRLGLKALIDAASPRQKTPTIDTRYTFCLPGEHAAQRFWRALFHEIRAMADAKRRPFDQAKVQKTIKQLDQQDALRVFSVPQFLCGCPVAVFDPNTADPSGFVFYYHTREKRDLVSVAQMDPTSLETWKELVHGPLEIDQIERKRVPYKA
jgi:hypothetical protein